MNKQSFSDIHRKQMMKSSEEQQQQQQQHDDDWLGKWNEKIQKARVATAVQQNTMHKIRSKLN